MPRLYTESEIISTINDIIDKQKKIDPTYNVKFLGFEKNVGFIGRKNSKIILKDIKYNQIEIISLDHFITRGKWVCDKRRIEHIPKKTQFKKYNEEEIIKKIITIIKDRKIPVELIKLINFNQGTKSLKILLKCKKHNIEFSIKYNSIFSKKFKGCPICNKINYRNSRAITPKEAQNQIINLFKNDPIKYDYSLIENSYKDYTSEVNIKCPIHNEIFTINFCNLLRRKPGSLSCPSCRKLIGNNTISNFELLCRDEIEKYLNKDKIVYHYKINLEKDIQKFLKRKYIVPDIVIPFLGLIIEIDGLQHYYYNKFYHNNLQDFINQVNRDNYLKTYSESVGYTLIRIPYVDINRINEVVKEIMINKNDITTKLYPKLLPIKL